MTMLLAAVVSVIIENNVKGTAMHKYTKVSTDDMRLVAVPLQHSDEITEISHDELAHVNGGAGGGGVVHDNAGGGGTARDN